MAHAAGVTIITHGLNGDVNDWIIPMAQQIPGYDSFPGTTFSCYQVTVAADYSLSKSRIAGVSPLVSDSGEIVIKLVYASVLPFRAAIAGVSGKARVTRECERRNG